MKRITEPSFVVDDLMPGIEYLFRVMASNQIGLSKPSAESDRIKMAQTSMESDFLQEPFENRYQLLEEISRCVYCMRGGSMCVCVCVCVLYSVGRKCVNPNPPSPFLPLPPPPSPPPPPTPEVTMVRSMSASTMPPNRHMQRSSFP